MESDDTIIPLSPASSKGSHASPRRSMFAPQPSQRFLTLDDVVHPEDDTAAVDSDEGGETVPEDAYLAGHSPSYGFSEPILSSSLKRTKARQHSIDRTQSMVHEITHASDKTALSKMTQRSWFG